MRRLIPLVGGVLVGLTGCRGGLRPDGGGTDPGPPRVAWSADVQAVADGNNRFALDLYAKLREREAGNLFFSPYSAHTALAMTAAGARGTTRDQVVKVLHLPAEAEKAAAAGDLGRFYAHPRRDYELSVANALWGQMGLAWRPEFLDLQRARFGAAFHEADFAADPDGERRRINRWVEEQTRDRIKELLKEGVITPATKMVLANAIHFKRTWKTQFDPAKTRVAPFHLSDGGKATAPLMYADRDARYAELQDGTKLLEVPYTGGKLSMVVILPKLPDGLPAVEQRLTADTLAGWLGGLREVKLGVSLPRFRHEQAFNLPESLKALGMVDAFGSAADFGGMLEGGGLWIGPVVHKACVEVNEEGTEAAAATAVVMVKSPDPPPTVADHPFLFLIRDTAHGTILFLGRVERP